MRRELPRDLSYEGLFAPQRDYDFFAGAAGHPFGEATAAWWLAEASLLAYIPEEDRVRAAWGRAGFDDFAVFEKKRTHAHAASNGTVTIVAFRGTDSVRRFTQNLRMYLAPNRAGGHVHEGYRNALAQVWKPLLRWLDGRPCWFTGHSLGASLALLAAARYDASRAVYTFGSPRVGNAEFAGSITVPVLRYVNNNDIATRLPPPIGYHHVGELRYFGADGTLHDEPRLWDRLKQQWEGHWQQAGTALGRWLDGDLRAIGYGPLVDHAMIHYAIHTWNAMERSHRPDGAQD